ncbi:MAG: prepilin-type N-terminal cleavage/methylation domain-containing protein [bacterium]|nr:prepilin-type N-terminal cleavage/methylation domain-containing protein [bacterium]
MGHRQTAFTLVEILIVVVILGILAAIVIPQFTSAAEDSKLSNLMSNLQAVRAQLELYKMHHNENYPTSITKQLTGKTNSDGTINSSGAYGPYLHLFPVNPFIDDAVEAAKTSGGTGEGWSYNAATGVITANTTGHKNL